MARSRWAEFPSHSAALILGVNTFFLMLTLFYCICVPYSHASAVSALKTHSSGELCVRQKFSLASCCPFQFPTSFSNTQLHLQAYSFSLVGWLKKHERFIGSSIRHGPEWETKCFPGAHSLLGNENIEKNNCIIHVFDREYSLWTTVNLKKAT